MIGLFCTATLVNIATAERDIITAKQLNEKAYIDSLCLKNPPITPVAETIRLAMAKINMGIEIFKLM